MSQNKIGTDLLFVSCFKKIFELLESMLEVYRLFNKQINFTLFLWLTGSIAGFFLISPKWGEQYFVICGFSNMSFFLLAWILNQITKTQRRKRVLVSLLLTKIFIVFGGGFLYINLRGFNLAAFMFGFHTPFLVLILGAFLGNLSFRKNL